MLPGEGQCRAVLESGKINLRTEHGVAAVDVGECASMILFRVK
ncbi:MAG: hypothetical protein ACLU4N_11890 [Butyricimonas faecihominis]